MPDITIIGKFIPGTSPLHCMDPRAKLFLALALIVVTFCAQGFVGLGVCALFVASFFRIAEIPLGQALKSVAPLLFIVVITALLNIFMVQGGQTLVQWGIINISERGLYQAGFVGVRVFLLLLGMSLLTLTTTTLDLSDAFERIMAPFRRIGVPVHELSMIMGIAIRFFPQFMEELRIIYRAQISRGANFSSSPLKGGLRILTSLMVPLFTSAFRHAETLSLAMDARCYHGGPGRTRLRSLHFGKLDRNAALLMAGMFAVVVLANIIF